MRLKIENRERKKYKNLFIMFQSNEMIVLFNRKLFSYIFIFRRSFNYFDSIFTFFFCIVFSLTFRYYFNFCSKLFN